MNKEWIEYDAFAFVNIKSKEEQDRIRDEYLSRPEEERKKTYDEDKYFWDKIQEYSEIYSDERNRDDQFHSKLEKMKRDIEAVKKIDAWKETEREIEKRRGEIQAAEQKITTICALISAISFVGSWIYCTFNYGYLLGFGLGWIASGIAALLVFLFLRYIIFSNF